MPEANYPRAKVDRKGDSLGICDLTQSRNRQLAQDTIVIDIILGTFFPPSTSIDPLNS